MERPVCTSTTPRLPRNAESSKRSLPGKKGGPWVIISTLVSSWLPTEVAKIGVKWGDSPSVTVGTVGEIKLQAVKDEAGRQAKIVNAPALGAFQVESAELFRSDGTRFSDPKMRAWQSGGSGSMSSFSWSA